MCHGLTVIAWLGSLLVQPANMPPLYSMNWSSAATLGWRGESQCCYNHRLLVNYTNKPKCFRLLQWQAGNIQVRRCNQQPSVFLTLSPQPRAPPRAPSGSPRPRCRCSRSRTPGHKSLLHHLVLYSYPGALLVARQAGRAGQGRLGVSVRVGGLGR